MFGSSEKSYRTRANPNRNLHFLEPGFSSACVNCWSLETPSCDITVADGSTSPMMSYDITRAGRGLNVIKLHFHKLFCSYFHVTDTTDYTLYAYNYNLAFDNTKDHPLFKITFSKTFLFTFPGKHTLLSWSAALSRALFFLGGGGWEGRR